MKKLYKILAFIAIIFVLFKVYDYKKKMSVISHFNRVIPEDNFFYSDDLESHWLLTYGTRYKGTVYSDKLKEIKSKKGILIYFSSLDYGYLFKESKNFRTWYDNAFYYNEAESIVSDEARKTFGKDIIVYVGELYTPDDFIKFVELNKGKNAKYKIKCTMYIDVFVDDITYL